MKLFEIAKSKSALQQALSNCKKNVAISMDSSNFLYRGFDHFMEHQSVEVPSIGTVNFLVVPGRTEDRQSLTGSNTMMNFTSFSPAWKNVPKRQRSNSCTFNYEVSKAFSDIGGGWVVFPFDTVNSYGYCGQDFNYLTMPYELGGSSSNIMEFGTGLWRLVSRGVDILEYQADTEDAESKKMLALGLTLSDKLDTYVTQKLLLDTSRFIEYIKKAFPEKAAEDRFIREFTKRNPGKTVYDAYLEHLTPESVNVKVVNSLASVPDIEGESEIWFDGPYVAIKPDNDAINASNLIRDENFRKYILGKN